MARTVSPRLSYEGEAAFLIRLGKAIEIDQRHSPEWKKAASSLLSDLTSLLLLRDSNVSEDLAANILRSYEKGNKKRKGSSKDKA